MEQGVDAETARRRDSRNYVFGFGRRCVFPVPLKFLNESERQLEGDVQARI